MIPLVSQAGKRPFRFAEKICSGLFDGRRNIRVNFMHSVDGKAHAVGAKFKNAQLDELLSRGVQLKDEAPWVFLLWRPQAEATAKFVKGYVNVSAGLGRVNVSRFEHVWLDK